MGLSASQGEQGEQGEQGKTGPKGDAGAQGPPGNYKKELDFILGSEDTTRGNSGQSRAISKILHNDKPTLAFNYETDFAGGNLFFGNTQIKGSLDATSFTLNGAPFTGAKGDQGVGIKSSDYDQAKGELKITLTDDTIQGPFFIKGDKGDTGAPGLRGADGAPGAPGSRGADGAPGAPGSRGADGAPGAPGSRGAQGPRGETGAQGPRGETGPSLGPYYVRIGGGSDHLDSKQFSGSRKGVHAGSDLNLNKQWSYDPMSRHLRSIADDICLTNRDGTFVLEGCRDNDELQVVTFRDDKRLQITDKCFDKNSSTRAYNCDGNQDFQRAVFRNVNFKPSASSVVPTVTQPATTTVTPVTQPIQTTTSAVQGLTTIGTTIVNVLSECKETTCPDSLLSKNGKYKLEMQTDGNLVVYYLSGTSKQKQAQWSSKTNNIGQAPYKLVMQSDGNLVIYDKAGKATWSSNSGPSTNRKNPYNLVLQDDGNLVIYGSDYVSIWSSKSGISTAITPTQPVQPEITKTVTTTESTASIFGATEKISAPTVTSSTTTSECTNTCSTSLVSKSGLYEAQLIGGNLVITNIKTNTNVWSSSSQISFNLNAPYKLVMQSDGNLVIYDKSEKTTWSSNSAPTTNRKNPYKLVLQDDGNLVIYGNDNVPIWARK